MQQTKPVTEIHSDRQQFESIQHYLNQQILGQHALILRILIALLADGHLLVEGAPGLAKTRAIKALAQCIESDFHRIQFTPDLLPSDLTGTDIYRPENSSFVFQPGPLFHNLILADEINRAPAKVQSALLEAMAERQITIGQTTYALPSLFLVMATQNPIEQEGTYTLPEAQLDRFLMYTRVNYPHLQVEKEILQLARREAQTTSPISAIPKISAESIFAIRQAVLSTYMSPALEEYCIQLVMATRQPESYQARLKNWVRYGASPRATIALDRCARAHAWLHQRDYVSPEDIQALAHDILRHRVILAYDIQAQGITTDDFIDELLQAVAAP